MADTTISTNMGLPIPVVGTDPGPQWATDNNSCLNLIDAHNHSAGSGVQITPDGLNINTDLSFGSNSATALKKVTFTSQSGALTGTNFVSTVSGNLYYNDGSGNQIPITSGGGVAGSPGSIGSLASPASATYSAGSKLFTWLADSGKSAAMDNGAVTIRETNVASAKGITLASPTSLGADYQLTLLTGLPGSTQVLNVSSAGNMGTISYDTIGSSMTSTGANAIAATMTATGANAVSATRTRTTGTSVGVGGVAISASISDTTNTTTPRDVTNSSITITTSGRPVFLTLTPDTSGSSSFVESFSTVGPYAFGFIYIYRGASLVGKFDFDVTTGDSADLPGIALPPGCVTAIDAVAAGTYTYKLQFATGSMLAASQVEIIHCRFVAYEL